MQYAFKTESDDETFVIDVSAMTWGRASQILSAPSVGAAANDISNYVCSESGKLIPQGAGVYNLEGRISGLTTIGLLAIPFENSLVFCLHPNVKVKEESFQSGKIDTFVYKVIQPKEVPAKV